MEHLLIDIINPDVGNRDVSAPHHLCDRLQQFDERTHIDRFFMLVVLVQRTRSATDRDPLNAAPLKLLYLRDDVRNLPAPDLCSKELRDLTEATCSDATSVRLDIHIRAPDTLVADVIRYQRHRSLEFCRFGLGPDDLTIVPECDSGDIFRNSVT